MKPIYLLLMLCLPAALRAQSITPDTISRWTEDSILLTIDRGENWKGKPGIVILYALPNGNTTAQTFGKRLQPGDDWHYDIQHIGAQTAFIRRAMPQTPVTVIYLENNLKSWPAWRRSNPGAMASIRALVDSLQRSFPAGTAFCLNGHSGGGSFIFGYLSAVQAIPGWIKRISFIDSNYGYEANYAGLFTQWLNGHSDTHLNVFAYNDSVALYQGKRIVSDTGGTWHRSHRMMKDLSAQYVLETGGTDTLQQYTALQGRIRFYLLQNFDRGIYHTQQVERNGFIHSVLGGTALENAGYRYYGERAYTPQE